MAIRPRNTTRTLFALALVFLLYALMTGTPGSFTRGVRSAFLAAASLSVSVAPNQYNTVAQQLAQKEAQLNAKEAALDAESSTRSIFGQDMSFYSLCMSALLFVLVAINFFYDLRRARQAAGNLYRVNLR